MSSISYDAPRAAVGNLRFTATGVYADYLVSGLPFIFLAKDAQDRVADVHAELLRTPAFGGNVERADNRRWRPATSPAACCSPTLICTRPRPCTTPPSSAHR